MFSKSYPVASALEQLQLVTPDQRSTAALVCHLAHAMGQQMRAMPDNVLMAPDPVHMPGYYTGTIERWSDLSDHLDATYANQVEKVLWLALSQSILAFR